MTPPRVPDATIEELLELEAKATPGDWSIPHLAIDHIKCQCPYVLSEGYAGSICDISISDGLSISEGGNDAPSREEAIANARLIPASRNHLRSILLELRESRQVKVDLVEALKLFTNSDIALAGPKSRREWVQALIKNAEAVIRRAESLGTQAQKEGE